MSKSEKTSLIHLVGGGLSGMVACIVLQPLDLIKTRLQQQHQDHLAFLRHKEIAPHNSTIYSTIKDIINKNGYSGLWRGTIPTIVRNVPGSAMYFFALSEIRGVVTKTRAVWQPAAQKDQRLDSLISGAAARGTVGFIMMPVTVVKVRFESNLYNYHSLNDAFKSIIKADGIRGLFAGFGATIIRDAPFAGIYLFFYESFKAWATTNMPVSHTFINMGSGFLAGMTASTMTQPFDMVKTRMQLKPTIYRNLVQSAKKVYLEEGLMGFFDGISVRIIRKPLNSAISWTIYEEVVRWHKLRDQLIKEKL